MRKSLVVYHLTQISEIPVGMYMVNFFLVRPTGKFSVQNSEKVVLFSRLGCSEWKSVLPFTSFLSFVEFRTSFMS